MASPAPVSGRRVETGGKSFASPDGTNEYLLGRWEALLLSCLFSDKWSSQTPSGPLHRMTWTLFQKVNLPERLVNLLSIQYWHFNYFLKSKNWRTSDNTRTLFWHLGFQLTKFSFSLFTSQTVKLEEYRSWSQKIQELAGHGCAVYYSCFWKNCDLSKSCMFIYQMEEIPSTSSTFKLIFDIFEKMLINHKMFINACGLLQ